MSYSYYHMIDEIDLLKAIEIKNRLQLQQTTDHLKRKISAIQGVITRHRHEMGIVDEEANYCEENLRLLNESLASIDNPPDPKKVKEMKRK